MTSSPHDPTKGGNVSATPTDPGRLAALAATGRPFQPQECAERAERAAGFVDADALPRTGLGSALRLWQDEHSVAWLNTWWERRDTGYHDHDGSAVGVHVVQGSVTNEGLPTGGPRRPRHYGPGESFSVPGSGIHRMDHDAGAITIHVYSPPLRAIGYYDIVDGLLQRVPGPPDESSPASPRLLESLDALTPPAVGDRPRTVADTLARARAGLHRLDPAQAWEAARHGALLVDIRPEYQRRADGEFPGAIVIERNHLEWRCHPDSPARIPEATGSDIGWIICCSEGDASSLAAATLQALGLAGATDLAGGFQAWRAAGLPISRPATPSRPRLPGVGAE